MSTPAFDLYFATRLAFIDRPEVRIRTEDEPGGVRVHLDERLRPLVMSDPTRHRIGFSLETRELPSPPSFDTIGPNPPIHFHGEVRVDALALDEPRAREHIAGMVARQLRHEYDAKWREELT